jgi:hypothetical protein
MSLVREMITDDPAAALRLLAAFPTLAHARFAARATRQAANANHLHEIAHHLYVGDTALPIAAVAYHRALVAMGADVRTRNRRGAEPLHYAVDRVPGQGRWNPRAATMTYLVEMGADPNATGSCAPSTTARPPNDDVSTDAPSKRQQGRQAPRARPELIFGIGRR